MKQMGRVTIYSFALFGWWPMLASGCRLGLEQLNVLSPEFSTRLLCVPLLVVPVLVPCNQIFQRTTHRTKYINERARFTYYVTVVR